MAIRVAINGCGRIGRFLTKLLVKNRAFELVALNDLNSIDQLAYLLSHDSVHGRFDEVIKKNDSTLTIAGYDVTVLQESHHDNLNFGIFNVDIVFECTGKFLTSKEAQVHLKNGVKKVIFSGPALDDTPTFVLGVNEEQYHGEAIISNASCTTNCLAPITKYIHSHFGISKGLMTTIHSYTNDQNLIDAPHAKEYRRARSAAYNIIPTTTGAAQMISRVLPELEGKLHGQSVRVPVPDVSMLDLTVVLEKETSKEEMNDFLENLSRNELKNLISIDKNYGVSQDFLGSPYSSIIATDLTQVMQGNLVKIMAWYDNESGYSHRLCDMAQYILKEKV